MALYRNGQKIAGYTSGRNSSVIYNITLPPSEFVAQDDGSYLYTLTSSLVLAESMVYVAFAKKSRKAGMKAGITVESTAGTIYFYAEKLPTEGLIINWIRIVNPSQDDSYNESYATEINNLQNPIFEDYSSTDYPEELDTSLAKIVSTNALATLLEGIKGSLLWMKATIILIRIRILAWTT